MRALRNRVEKAGLEVVGIDRLPHPLDRAILGAPGRDEEIEATCRFIRDAGAAGIPLIGYDWTPPGGGRPERTPTGRGRAYVASYDATRTVKGAVTITDGQMWENLTYFLESVIPVAEESGVRMACRPDDPFLTSGKATGILNSLEGLKRCVETVSSPCHGLDFCQGMVAEMPDTNLHEAIRWFAMRKKIFVVTVRHSRGTRPAFSEAFLDEGDTVILEILQIYREVGFDGALRPGPQPGMVGDTDWGHKAQAFSVGYLRALLQSV